VEIIVDPVAPGTAPAVGFKQRFPDCRRVEGAGEFTALRYTATGNRGLFGMKPSSRNRNVAIRRDCSSLANCSADGPRQPVVRSTATFTSSRRVIMPASAFAVGFLESLGRLFDQPLPGLPPFPAEKLQLLVFQFVGCDEEFLDLSCRISASMGSPSSPSVDGMKPQSYG
jgi:hypothetical protein